jgi:hypothetical protein
VGIRENKVETYLSDKVKEIGGLCYKWTSPGRPGVPDRIVIHEGNSYFVEIKTVDGRLSGQQLREFARLRDKGAEVFSLYGVEEVDEFIVRLQTGEWDTQDANSK